MNRIWSLFHPPTRFCCDNNGNLLVSNINGYTYAILSDVGEYGSYINYDGTVIIEGCTLENHDIPHPTMKCANDYVYVMPWIMVAINWDNSVRIPIVVCLSYPSENIPMHSYGCCGNTLLKCSHTAHQLLIEDYNIHNSNHHVEWDIDNDDFSNPSECSGEYTEWNSDDDNKITRKHQLSMKNNFDSYKVCVQ